MKKKLSILVAAVLFVGLAWPIPASAASLYFTAINDSVAPLSSDTMPFWSGGTLYVPYTVFDANQNGINVSLGLYTSYNRSNGTITLFNLRQMLVFDLNNGTCRDDMTGTTYSSRAIVRNGRPFLSLNMVCSFFGLEYSYSQLPYIAQGYLVRIKSAGAVNDDAGFIDAARNVINNRFRDYTQSLSSADTTNSARPNTGSGTNPGSGNNNSGTATPSEPLEPDGTKTATYLAFRCESAEGLTDILSVLDSGGERAVFFLTPQLLENEGDLVRRTLGTGHSIGILIDGGEEAGHQLDRGTRALETAARTRTTLAYAPDGQREALEEEGWVCWQETTLLQPDGSTNANTYASNAVRRLGNRDGTVYLTLEGGENAADVLPALLRDLSRDNYIVSIPLETRL